MAPLLSFRAGRAFRQGETNTVVPAPGRGLITIEEEDGLMHFYWKDLEANAVVEDLIIFPGDATFIKAADRVHVLKFSSSSARSFFWHQDPSSDQDEERAAKVNELIGATLDHNSGEMDVELPITSTSNNAFTTPAPSSRIAVPPPSEPSATAAASTAASAPASAPTATPSSALGSEAQMAQLRNILAGIQGTSSSGSRGAGLNDVPEYQLQDVLSSFTLSSLLSSPSPELLARLAPFLPTGLPGSDAESLRRATIGTPEFRRSVAALDRALRTGALGPLVRGLGLDEEAAFGVDAFLEGVRKQAKEREGEEESGGKMEE